MTKSPLDSSQQMPNPKGQLGSSQQMSNPELRQVDSSPSIGVSRVKRFTLPSSASKHQALSEFQNSQQFGSKKSTHSGAIAPSEDEQPSAFYNSRVFDQEHSAFHATGQAKSPFPGHGYVALSQGKKQRKPANVAANSSTRDTQLFTGSRTLGAHGQTGKHGDEKAGHQENRYFSSGQGETLHRQASLLRGRHKDKN
jgi:hypothetical protein